MGCKCRKKTETKHLTRWMQTSGVITGLNRYHTWACLTTCSSFQHKGPLLLTAPGLLSESLLWNRNRTMEQDLGYYSRCAELYSLQRRLLSLSPGSVPTRSPGWQKKKKKRSISFLEKRQMHNMEQPEPTWTEGPDGRKGGSYREKSEGQLSSITR